MPAKPRVANAPCATDIRITPANLSCNAAPACAADHEPLLNPSSHTFAPGKRCCTTVTAAAISATCSLLSRHCWSITGRSDGCVSIATAPTLSASSCLAITGNEPATFNLPASGPSDVLPIRI